ncbi:protein of unknown function (DUF928) [Rivularia sp. PCC 7116]|uniref:DUF928 domain-containing protein n=1 Tax=Rivularia sp. PCC 7116 TaxID=373994 RepID=UPI00029ED2DD|nr:DUF928 domain-containing protein [Rivularia sp. PCC 7116]AFY54232.1 protein of unknown function (DUF928) [Rivularia sp. PCC 7116]
MKIINLQNKIIFTISVILVNIILSPVLVAAQTNSQEDDFPAAPDTGTPVGTSTPGGSRPNTNCPETKLPLRALIANNGKDFTVAEYPNLLFNVPYASNQISNIEFALKDPAELKTVYRTAIKLTGKPGIVKVSIPQKSEYALKSNKDYRWNLILYCRGNKTDEPDQVLTGWIKSVPMKTQLNNQEYQSYIENNIWYDGISLLADKYFADPNNSKLKADWQNLSKSLKWDNLDNKGFAEIVLVEPAE